jgi:hypothetical protein
MAFDSLEKFQQGFRPPHNVQKTLMYFSVSPWHPLLTGAWPSFAKSSKNPRINYNIEQICPPMYVLHIIQEDCAESSNDRPSNYVLLVLQYSLFVATIFVFFTNHVEHAPRYLASTYLWSVKHRSFLVTHKEEEKTFLRSFTFHSRMVLDSRFSHHIPAFR